MQTEKILKYYWDLFLSHTCEYYALEMDFMEAYEYELDWVAISKNQGIAWSIDFLEKYEARFAWHLIAMNESILWDDEKIDRFKKRLEWQYLGHNKNLPVTEDFIAKYAKKLVIFEDNPLVSKTLIDKYKIKIIPKNPFYVPEIKVFNESDFEKIFEEATFNQNEKVIYEKIFLPIINERALTQIFKDKFNYSQRYYFLEPIQYDIHGLTPEFEIDGFNPFNETREDREPFTFHSKLTLVNGSLQEGPDRLYEIPRFRSFSYSTILLISENVKQILDQCKLPVHIYHEVNLVPKKINTHTKFYILQLAFDTLNNDLNYNDNTFHYSLTGSGKREYGVLEEKINNQTELMAITKKMEKIHWYTGNYVTIKPGRYNLTTGDDLYSYSKSNKIIINQHLKDILERNFPGQIHFTSAQLLDINIDQLKYDEKEKLSDHIKLSSKLSYTESAEDKFFYAKMERLENSDLPIATKNWQDKFTKKELELNVIFPQLFKDNYLCKKIKINYYRILRISKFNLQHCFADRYPETYKSVVIAENGVGDTVNLILEKDSDHLLQNRFFEFLHETGEFRVYDPSANKEWS